MNEAIRDLVSEATTAEVFGVWFLIGAALVFWMQAGFAMVEAGFTRAKNTGQYYNEKPYGLLHWYSNVHTYRFWFAFG